MYRDDVKISIIMVLILIILIFWGMFEISTCMKYKDTPAGEVPQWVNWVL